MEIVFEILFEVYLELMMLIVPKERLISKKYRVFIIIIAFASILGILVLFIWGLYLIADKSNMMGLIPVCLAIILSLAQIIAGSILHDKKLDFAIQKATQSDASVIADIHRHSWNFAYDNILSSETLKKFNAHRHDMWKALLLSDNDSHYAIKKDKDIIGFLSVSLLRDDKWSKGILELTALYLEPYYIGEGYGFRAMEWVKSEAEARGYAAISLWVLSKNYRAKSFYEKYGFKHDGKVKDSGMDSEIEERYILKL